MDKCSPVEMRMNMTIAESLKKSGIDFVCVPVISKEDKHALLIQADKAFEKLAAECEKE